MSFKDYFIDTIQKQIDEFPQVIEGKDDTQIACVFFAYENQNLIKLLRKRGTHLESGAIRKIFKTENEINKLIEE
jgi:hypothetical protein